MFEMQRNLKKNNEDLQDYVKDLDSWNKEVLQKDRDPKKRDPNRNVSEEHSRITTL